LFKALAHPARPRIKGLFFALATFQYMNA